MPNSSPGTLQHPSQNNVQLQQHSAMYITEHRSASLHHHNTRPLGYINVINNLYGCNGWRLLKTSYIAFSV